LVDIIKYLPLIVSYTILCHVRLYSDEKFIKNLVYFMLVVLFIRYISAIIVDIIFPNTARLTAGAIENRTMLFRIGAGSYSLINSGFLLILPLVYYQKSNNQKKSKILIGILLSVIIISTYVTNWTTAIIFSFLTLIMALIVYSKVNHSFNILLVIFLCACFFLLYIDTIINKFNLINFRNHELYLKLSNMINVIGGGQAEDDLAVRNELYSLSINTINNNILLGNLQSPYGGHSFFLDYIARYGLLGITLLTLTYISVMKYSMQFIPKRYKVVQILNFLLYFAFGMLKNIVGYEFLINIFVLGPLIMYIAKTDSCKPNIKKVVND